jgi:peptide/nickel transport system substrate-binding protein
MRFRLLGLLIPLAVLSTVLAATAFSTNSVKNGGTVVFGAASDPVLLDGSIVSDGESLRPINQIFEGLVGLKPGTTQLRPLLATNWFPSKNGLTWTFNLRKGVKFQDGTPFNAAAVCYNFNRWFNFPSPLQNAGVSYYWNTVFGGFAHPGAGNPGPGKSLYKSCKTSGNYRAKINLSRRSSSFIGALALTNFGIASPTALKKYNANAGTTDSGGVFHPSGSYATRHPTGTGPFMFKSWTVGSKLVLVRNPKYWGAKAHLDQVIFRPISDNAARLQALQSGEIQGYDLVDPNDIKTIRSNKSLKLLNRPAFNIGYVGINQAHKPFNNIKVRQALAYGLNRAAVVQGFYAGRGVVANQFLPDQVVGYATKGVPSYTFNPNKAKALLKAAGLSLPVPVDFWYPTNVARPYMPNPQANAIAFGQSLEQSGFKVTFHSKPWRPDYLSNIQGPNNPSDIYLLGWTGDFGDPANFLNVHFGQFNPQFGFHNTRLFTMLQKADSETNLAKRAALYKAASIYVMKFLPMVPYVHSKPALAFRKNVNGYIPSPVSLEPFSTVYLGT